jgi:hypothetical protein
VFGSPTIYIPNFD